MKADLIKLVFRNTAHAYHTHISDEHLRLPTAPTLEPICAWLFATCARGFNNDSVQLLLGIPTLADTRTASERARA